MKRFLIYFQLECRRILRLFWQICIITLVLAAIGMVFLWGSSMKKQKDESEKKRLHIGLVVSEEDYQFIGIGMYLLEHADDIKYVCEFEVCSEEEGQDMLESGKLDALLIFPDDYVQSVYNGAEESIVFRFGKSQTGVTSLLFRQFSDSISDYMMNAKAGVYAMQDMYSQWNIPYRKAADRLAERYVMKILERGKLLTAEQVDVTDGVSFPVYYICAAVVMLLLLWGLNCGSVLGKKDGMFSAMLQRRGLNRGRQLLAKYSALLILFFLNFSVLVFLFFSVLQITGIAVGGIETLTLAEMALVYIKLLPSLFLSTAFILCIFEISEDSVGAMLFCFFITVILGFFSGFFYPLSYFPGWLQEMAEWLPSRVLFSYITACVSDGPILHPLINVALYSVFFGAVCVVFGKEKVSW